MDDGYQPLPFASAPPPPPPIREGHEEQARETSAPFVLSRSSTAPLLLTEQAGQRHGREWWVTAATSEYMENRAGRRDFRKVVLPLLGVALGFLDALAAVHAEASWTVFAAADAVLVIALAIVGHAAPAWRWWPDAAAVAALAAHAAWHELSLAAAGASSSCSGASSATLAIFALSTAGVHSCAQIVLLLGSLVATASAGTCVPATAVAGLLSIGLGAAVEWRAVAVFVEAEELKFLGWQAQIELDAAAKDRELLEAELTAAKSAAQASSAEVAQQAPAPLPAHAAAIAEAPPASVAAQAAPAPRPNARPTLRRTNSGTSVASSLNYSQSGASSQAGTPTDQQPAMGIPKPPSKRTVGSPFDANASSASGGSGTFASGASSRDSKLTCNIMLAGEDRPAEPKDRPAQERKSPRSEREIPGTLQNALTQLAKQREGSPVASGGGSGGGSEFSAKPPGVETAAQTDPQVRAALHDVATETTISNTEKEGFICRRCGLPPSLPKPPGSQQQSPLPRSSESAGAAGGRPPGNSSDSRSTSSRGSRGSRSSRGSRRSRGDPGAGDGGFAALIAAGADPFVSAFRLTEAMSFNLALEWAIKHWNLPRVPNTCCPFHAYIFVARQVLKFESASVCDPLWSALTGWQCPSCSCLNHAERTVCDMCCESKGESQSFDVSQGMLSQSALSIGSSA